MTRVISFISIKGGVGKTTLSSSVASSLVNHYGKKVLLVDANYSAPNLGLHMDILTPEKTIHDVLSDKARIKSTIVNKYGVDIIPGSYNSRDALNYLKLKDKLKIVKNDYDFVIIDSSPSLNEEVLSSILASDNLFVVSTPDYPTLYCSMRAASLAKQRGKPIDGIIVNKIRSPKYEVDMKEIEESLKINVVSRIPDDSDTTKALFLRIPMPIFNRYSRFSKEIDKLSRAIAGITNKSFLDVFKFGNMKKEQVNREVLKDNFYSPVFDVNNTPKPDCKI